MRERTQRVCGGMTKRKKKTAVRRKEAGWKGVLAVSNEETKERCMKAYRVEKRKVKR